MSAWKDDNRSWVEICDEEEALSDEKSRPVDESLEEGELRDNSRRSSIFNESTNKAPEPSELDSKLSTSTPSKTEFVSPEWKSRTENTTTNVLSYAKVLSKGITTSPSTGVFSGVKVQATTATEDLSLTSHLDIFHVDSPQKDPVKSEVEIELFVDEDTVMFSPEKSKWEENSSSRNAKRPFMLIDSPLQETRNRNSGVHDTRKKAKAEINSDVHSSSPVNQVNSPSGKRELEVNPEILSRRQKQIDYGKNTLGYERYLKLVPKRERTKEHPKTPPKHLKMSRRTWDGLIRNWRLKLHKWDPDPADVDNPNFDQFSFSSEDQSSFDSASVPSDSTVSTPKQCLSIVEGEEGRSDWNGECPVKSENSKELWSKCAEKTDKSDDDEYLGCEPLTENCVKACS